MSGCHTLFQHARLRHGVVFLSTVKAAYCYQPLTVITFQSPIYYRLLIKIIGFCYNLVNVITFVLAKSDHIKRLLL